MDFFARQEKTRRATTYLVVLFAIAFLGVAIAASVAVGVVLNLLPDLDTPLLSTTLAGETRFDPWPLIGVGVGMLVFMLVASLVRGASLARGGAQVARMIGGTQLSRDTTEPLERRLVNVVEEIAIASGLPVPDIFVLEEEPAINAFAAGLDPANAAIAVTQGALERLERAELQGVVAHEFGHILNGDMRLNQRLIGYCFGILVLSLAGRWLLRSARFARGSRNRGLPVAVALGLALAIIGSIGIVFSRLIKAAVSRQREFLADASAVQFTREPSGLAGALKKIGGYTAHLSSVESEEIAHMLFGSGSKSFRGLFATHPPLAERIHALDPSSDGSIERAAATASPLPPDGGITALAGTDAGPASRLSNEALLNRTGTMEPAGVGRGLHAAIPTSLHDAAHSRESSYLLVLAMALTDEPASARSQERLLNERLGPARAALCLKLHTELRQLGGQLWLPLLELAVPALKQRPDEQIAFLFDMLAELRELDSTYGIFSFVLPRMLDCYLSGPVRPHPPARPLAKMTAKEAVNELLAAIAIVGHRHPDEAERAYRAGIKALRFKRSIEPSLSAGELVQSRRLPLLEAALAKLLSAPPRVKRELLRATLVTIRYDASISAEELEVYRAVAAALDCPVPPLAAITD